MQPVLASFGWVEHGGVGSVLCLTIGTGIGGAMLLNDKLINGSSFTACEVGYMHLSQGKFQDVASTKALIKQVASRKISRKMR